MTIGGLVSVALSRARSVVQKYRNCAGGC